MAYDPGATRDVLSESHGKGVTSHGSWKDQDTGIQAYDHGLGETVRDGLFGRRVDFVQGKVYSAV